MRNQKKMEETLNTLFVIILDEVNTFYWFKEQRFDSLRDRVKTQLEEHNWDIDTINEISYDVAKYWSHETDTDNVTRKEVADNLHQSMWQFVKIYRR